MSRPLKYSVGSLKRDEIKGPTTVRPCMTCGRPVYLMSSLYEPDDHVYCERCIIAVAASDPRPTIYVGPDRETVMRIADDVRATRERRN